MNPLNIRGGKDALGLTDAKATRCCALTLFASPALLTSPHSRPLYYNRICDAKSTIASQLPQPSLADGSSHLSAITVTRVPEVLDLSRTRSPTKSLRCSDLKPSSAKSRAAVAI
ncbi:hypothetical protein PTRG_07993 [Pyrenophora tritici-repentis Pt-1C-BFP]|uniref:Uncharacterized protein n=1 Tax=Pyrenophora tritici-repentis (strain Pt-1C-BFP) TaxID=426418 RepID=B2WDD4_PYRTR|nr:uncharacterized protein PTRG_07993 [Pyrenophora tritici-repentis Pt-1C-BFP]EDU50912.1 hypothetical protein PTRG_07993 [Pyrenophora tritici-repentis Pt-1C-BFP]